MSCTVPPPREVLLLLNATGGGAHPTPPPNLTTDTSYVDEEFISQMQWYQNADFIIDRYVTHVVCLFGIIGNLANIMALTRKTVSRHMGRLEKSVLVGLIALAISDFLYCFFSYPQAWQDRTKFDSRSIDFWLVYNAYGTACINCFLLYSSWLTVSMAVSRYLVICYPLKGKLWLGMTTSKRIISAVFVLSVLFNLPRFWMKQITWVECGAAAGGGKSYYIIPGYMETNRAGHVTYTWLYFIAGILLPLLILMYCNIFLVRALQVSSRLKKQRSSSTPNAEATRVVTLTLCVIIVLYIVLVGPAELVAFWKPFVVSDNALQYGLAVRICNAIQMLNFAVNFILYFIINVHFRKVIKDLVFCLHLREYIQPPPSQTEQDNTTHETSVML